MCNNNQRLTKLISAGLSAKEHSMGVSQYRLDSYNVPHESASVSDVMRGKCEGDVTLLNDGTNTNTSPDRKIGHLSKLPKLTANEAYCVSHGYRIPTDRISYTTEFLTRRGR